MTYVEALQRILGRGEDAKVQVLYLKLVNGKILVFLGAPMSEEDFMNIEDVVRGEQVHPFLLGLSNAVDATQAQ